MGSNANLTAEADLVNMEMEFRFPYLQPGYGMKRECGENPQQSHCCIYGVHLQDLKESATGGTGKAKVYEDV